jgi:hypothetical protein
MNKETIELIKQYIELTLATDSGGISSDAYRALINLMQTSKEMAQELHEIVNNIALDDYGFYKLNQPETVGYEF